MPRFAHLLTTLRRGLLPLLGLLIILVAALLSTARLILPLFDDEVHAWVEQKALEHGVKLSVARLELDWDGLGPRLSLVDTALFGENGGQPLRLDRLALTLDLLRSLFSLNLQFGHLEIAGVRLQVMRDAAGRWQLRGLDSHAASADAEPDAWPAWLGVARRVQLVDGQLDLHDEQSGLEVQVDGIEALLELGANEQRLALKLQLPETLGGNVEVRARAHGDRNTLRQPTGEVWLKSDALNLVGWRRLLSCIPGGGLNLPLLEQEWPRLDSGHMDGQLWLQLRQGQLVDALAMVSLDNWRINAIQALLAGEREVSLQTLLAVHLHHEENDWMLDIESRPLIGRGGPQRFSIRREDDQRLAMAAERISLDLLRPWLAVTPILPPQARQLLILHHPQGELLDLRAHVKLSSEDAPLQIYGQMRFDNLAWRGNGYLPDGRGLSGRLWLQGESALVALNSPGLRLDFHDKFRRPMRFDHLRGELAAFWSDTPRIVGSNLVMANEDLALELGLQLDLPPDAAPQVDISGHFRNVHTAAIPHYLPVKEIGTNTLKWLDQALRNSGGLVPEGRLELHGDLGRFPHFDDHSGRFEVRFNIQNLNLNFDPDWYPAQNLHGELAFINNGLQGRIEGGQILDVPLSEGQLNIPDFDLPRLHLDLQLDGKIESMLEVLKSSPLIPQRRELDAIQLTGPATLHTQIEVRLDSMDPKPSKAVGYVNLQGARLRTYGQGLDQIRGTIHFVDDAIHAEGIRALYKQNRKARLKVATNTHDRRHTYLITLNSETEMADWLPKGSSLGQRLQGRFPVEARLTIPPSTSQGREIELDVRSDLKGLHADLPAPLGKLAEATQATRAWFVWRKGVLELVRLNQPDRLDASLRLRDQRVQSGTIHFGPGSAPLPANDTHRLRLTWRVPRFDLSAWLPIFDAQGEGPNILPHDIELQAQVDSLHALGDDWVSMQVQGLRDNTGWQLTLQSPRLTGNLHYPTTPTPAEPVEAHLKRLVLKQDQAPSGDRPQSLDPSTLPPLRISIDELDYGDYHFKQALLHTLPQPHGMLIQKLSAQTDHLKVKGEGSWVLDEHDKQHTTLSLQLESGNVGEALSELGIRNALRGGRLEETWFRLSWPDAPNRFEWAILEGEGLVNVREGSIEQVEPGAGRVLGLLSIAELPRRLSLDFGDVFGEGLRFNRINTKLRFEQGRAVTEALDLDGPSARILMKGYSDMQNKTLHYDMVVVPALGNVLPVIGTVAGGPLVGGAVFLVQKLFEQLSDGKTGINYRITGPWDAPVVDKVPTPTETTP